MGSAAFLAPETRTSPRSLLPPRMTILYMERTRSWRRQPSKAVARQPSALPLGGGGDGRGGRLGGLGALLVLGTATGEHGALAAAFLAADLVAELAADLFATPANVVFAAVALGANRLLALGGAARLAAGLHGLHGFGGGGLLGGCFLLRHESSLCNGFGGFEDAVLGRQSQAGNLLRMRSIASSTFSRKPNADRRK